MKYLVNLDMSGNEIQNVVLQPLATAPSGPTIGRIYYDTADHCLKTYNGTGWDPAGAVFSVNNQTGAVTLTKSDVGLGNVDNKSEATIKSDFTGSIADGNTGFVTGDDVYDALALKMDASLKGAASGVAELDANGKVPASQLPAYVDDVVEGYYYNSKFYEEAAHTTEIAGESGKIYVDLSTEKTYRWSGSAYAEISSSLALGETSSTAYRGDRGKTAYDHSQLTSGNPHNVSKSDVGLGNVDNKSEATIKSDFTGSVADGDTGFVTGDAVYDAIAGMTEILSMTDVQYSAGSAGNAVFYTFTGTLSKKASEIATLVDNGVKVYVSFDNQTANSNVYSSLMPLVSIIRNNNTVVGATFDGTTSPNNRIKFTVDDTDSNNVQGKIISANHVYVFRNKGTIGTSSTSVTVNYSGVFIGAYADISGEMVMTSVSIGAGSVTFAIAAPPSAPITCNVVGFRE